MKALDLSGQRFGKLVAISVTYIGKNRGWACMCDCGNTKDVPTFALTSGNTVSCGCAAKAESLNGKAFGKLTALRVIERDHKWGREMYLCKCECGNEVKVPIRYLQRGTATHCGCVPFDFSRRYKPEAPQVLARIMDSYVRNASKREQVFELSSQEFEKLITSDCHYCGAAPSNTKSLRDYTLYWNGLDRLDNTVGYVPENVVPCCSDCNYLKCERNYDEFVEKISKIYNRLNMEE